MAIEAVIFDFDGVLADSKQTIFKIYESVCAELGIEFYDSISDFVNNLDGNYKHFYVKLGITGGKIKKANEIYKKYFMQFGQDITQFEGAKELLIKLSEMGMKIAISSNTHEFIVNTLLKRFKLDGYIDVVIGGKDINKLKPDPAQIILAMEKLGVDPAHVAYVGDMEVDMLAGKAAGVRKLIAVTYGFHTKEMLERFDPDAFADSPFGIVEKI